MLRIFICVFIFPFITSFLGEKTNPEDSKTYTVYINYSDYSVHANVLFDSGKIHPKLGYTYYWFTDNDIKQTDGGFDGKLLHGEYKSFYLNKNLKEEGIFRNGLKYGIWKTWFPDGKIHEIIHYRNSQEHGSYEVYDEDGYMITKSNFKNGVQCGKEISYQKGKVDTVVIYKKGQIVPQKKSKNIARVQDKKKSIDKKNPDKSYVMQDSVVQTPKSSINIKKVFNKVKINPKKKKEKTNRQPEKKSGKDSLPEKPKTKH